MANIQTEIKTRIDRIKANYQNYHNARKIIIEDMIYLENHKEQIKKATGKTFEELKTELTGFSKRYFNQLVSNYKFLEKFNRLELFDKVDVKAIEHAKKQNKPELLDDQANLKRPKSGRRSPEIIDAEIIEPPVKPLQTLPDDPQSKKTDEVESAPDKNIAADDCRERVKALDVRGQLFVVECLLNDLLSENKSAAINSIIQSVDKIIKPFRQSNPS